jgi:hypothetical protein
MFIGLLVLAMVVLIVAMFISQSIALKLGAFGGFLVCFAKFVAWLIG